MKKLASLGLLLGALLAIIFVSRTPDILPQGASQGLAPAGIINPLPDNAITRFSGAPVAPVLSVAVADLPSGNIAPSLDREIDNFHNPNLFDEHMGTIDLSGRTADPLLATSYNPAHQSPPPGITFDGLTSSEGGGWNPPDTVGAVGLNHYVQMVNMAFAIYDKQGNRLAGPTSLESLWSQAGGTCTTQRGDPIVVYDREAHRWLLSQFAQPNHLCVAISTSADPLGTYNLYTFVAPRFPDYFKFGAWDDGYYMGDNQGSSNQFGAYAFDRHNMLAGNAAGFEFFGGFPNFMMPANLGGLTPPPAGSPAPFYTYLDSSFHGGGNDRLALYEFDIDWSAPGAATFGQTQTIDIAAFNYTVCGYFVFDCVPQPGTGEGLAPIGEFPMWQLHYRNFGSHETLLANFTVDVSGSNQAGIRWYELRRTSGNWSIHQGGTHAPDSEHRFMGSIAMDRNGHIGLAYTLSSASTFPSMVFTTRAMTDTLNTLGAEMVMFAGNGSQTSSGNRWGDYSALTVDPFDDCTFWFTSEYYATTSNRSWRTRIGTFAMPDCAPPYSLLVPIVPYD